MKAWIARDEDGNVYLYFQKPIKEHAIWLPQGGDGWIRLSSNYGLKPRELRRVNISIKPVKK